ncbi:MAG: hypothetical protein AB1637_05155 [Elusimicrobiota bacterium]
MIGVLIKIILTAAAHILLFSSYPDTGKYGTAYFWISLVIWSSFWITYEFKFAAFKKLLFPISFIINAAAIAAMIFFITLTMPQEDGKPVLYKLAKFQFPDEQQLKRGRIKYLNSFTFSGGLKEGVLLKKAKEVLNKNE